MFVECCLGAWFAALLFRAWDLSLFAAAAGGILFVFACLIGQTLLPPEVSTILWLPWLLLCVERLVTRWQWRWWIGLTLGAALQLLAGFPQFAAYTYYVLVPYAALRLVGECRASAVGWRAALGRASLMCVAVGLGVGLAAPQLLPTLELVRHSTRAGALRPLDVHYLRGISAGAVLRYALDVSPKRVSFDFGQSGYLGVPTLIALVVGVIAGRRRPLVWLFVVVGTVSLVLSDGYRGWGRDLYALYASLPTGGMFRRPERLRVLTLFSAIAIASVGFNEFGSGPMRQRDRPAFRVALVLATLVTCLIVVLGTPAAAWRAALTLALFGMAVRWGERPVARRLCQAALLVLLVGDLTHATGRFGTLRAFPNRWSESFHVLGHTAIDGPEFRRLRDEVGLDRLAVHGMLPLTGAAPIDGAYRVACYETLFPSAWGMLNAKMGARRLSNRNLFDVDPVKFATFYDVASVRLTVRVATAGLADRAKAAAIARAYDEALRERTAPWPTLPPGLAIEHLVNDDALDRAYFINRFAVGTTNDALDHIVRGDVDFREVVLLDRDPGTADRGARAWYRPATIVSYAPERVVIDADAPTAGFVVLTDTDYPGWRAWVDAEETEIVRANGLYRAVPTARGHHRITFEYRPASLRWGFGIAAVSVGLLGLVPMLARARRRTPSRRAPGAPPARGSTRPPARPS
jgi:hypothetical protein